MGLKELISVGIVGTGIACAALHFAGNEPANTKEVSVDLGNGHYGTATLTQREDERSGTIRYNGTTVKFVDNIEGRSVSKNGRVSYSFKFGENGYGTIDNKILRGDPNSPLKVYMSEGTGDKAITELYDLHMSK